MARHCLRVMPFACATCWGQPARQLLT